jgi:hypothetical protein
LIDTQKVFLWRFNSRGKELWKKVYTLGYYPSKGQAVQIAFPGGFIETYNKSLVFCGYKRIYQGLDSSNDRSLNFLIQTDPNGNELKRFIWGDSSKMNRLSDLVQTSDSNIVVLGSIYDEGKLYLAKIHDLSSDVGNPDISDESSFDVYPNPTTGNINLKLENLNPSFIEVELFDNLGNVISKPYKDYIYNKEFETNFELSGVPQGVYNCVVKAGGRVFSKKVVVVR